MINIEKILIPILIIGLIVCLLVLGHGLDEMDRHGGLKAVVGEVWNGSTNQPAK